MTSLSPLIYNNFTLLFNFYLYPQSKRQKRERTVQKRRLYDLLTNELTKTHGVVGSLSNSEDVRWHLIPPLSSVESNSTQGVDGEPLVRIHSNTEKARVCLKLYPLVYIKSSQSIFMSNYIHSDLVWQMQSINI